MFQTIRSIFRSFKERHKAFGRPAGAKPPAASFYDLSIQKINDGPVLHFSSFKGKKVLLINTASHCGFTPQYAEWQRFHEQYGDKVVVLAFPSNDFFSQEPGNASDIEAFCQANYGTTFIITEKINVLGRHKHPVYKWLSDARLNGWNNREPSWNFCKYLVNEKGELTHYFGSAIKPGSHEFKQAAGL